MCVLSPYFSNSEKQLLLKLSKFWILNIIEFLFENVSCEPLILLKNWIEKYILQWSGLKFIYYILYIVVLSKVYTPFNFFQTLEFKQNGLICLFMIKLKYCFYHIKYKNSRLCCDIFFVVIPMFSTRWRRRDSISIL